MNIQMLSLEATLIALGLPGGQHGLQPPAARNQQSSMLVPDIEAVTVTRTASAFASDSRKYWSWFAC